MWKKLPECRRRSQESARASADIEWLMAVAKQNDFDVMVVLQ